MYSFHGAKPPALYLINFLFFYRPWLQLYWSLSTGITGFPFTGTARRLELQLITIYPHPYCITLYPVSSFVSPELILKGMKRNSRKGFDRFRFLDAEITPIKTNQRVMSGNVSRGTVMTKMALITQSRRAKILLNFLVDLASHGSLLSSSADGKWRQERDQMSAKMRDFKSLQGTSQVWSAPIKCTSCRSNLHVIC